MLLETTPPKALKKRLKSKKKKAFTDSGGGGHYMDINDIITISNITFVKKFLFSDNCFKLGIQCKIDFNSELLWPC